MLSSCSVIAVYIQRPAQEARLARQSDRPESDGAGQHSAGADRLQCQIRHHTESHQ